MSQNYDALDRVPHLGNMTMEEFYPMAEAAQMFREFALGWQEQSTIKLDIRFDFTPGQSPSLRVSGINLPLTNETQKPSGKLPVTPHKFFENVATCDPKTSDIARTMLRREADVPRALVETIPEISEPFTISRDAVAMRELVQTVPLQAVATPKSEKPVDGLQPALTGEPAAEPLPPPQAPAAGTPIGINEVATAGQKQAPWSEDEDACLVAEMAKALADKFTRNTAASYAALIVGRSFQGVLFRANTKLRDRIEAAVAAIRVVKKNAPPPEQAVSPIQGGGDASPATADVAAPSVAGSVGAVDPAAPTADIAKAWLQLLPMDGFSHAQDYDLLHFAGLRWPMGDIAAELDKGIKECQARYNALTQNRKLAVPDVMAALIQLHPELAENAA